MHVFIVEFRCFYISFLFTALSVVTKFFLPAIRQCFIISLILSGANGVGIACNNLMKTEAESGFRDIRRFQYLDSPAFLICIFACLSVSSGSFSLCLVLADILRYVFKTLNPIQNDLHPLPCFQMEKNRRVTVRLLSHSRRRRFSDSESDTDYPL